MVVQYDMDITEPEIQTRLCFEAAYLLFMDHTIIQTVWIIKWINQNQFPHYYKPKKALVYTNINSTNSKKVNELIELLLTGHCHRHPELSMHKLVLWKPSYDCKGRASPKCNYVNTLKWDTGETSVAELARNTNDRWGCVEKPCQVSTEYVLNKMSHVKSKYRTGGL